MKVKTVTLVGEALDWAVAVCTGLRPKLDEEVFGQVNLGWWVSTTHYFPLPAYSTDWGQGGGILSRERISRTIDHSGLWVAYWAEGYVEGDAGKKWMQCDRSELVAGMRCYVASKLGDEVEIPDELLKT